ncbi:MAG: hypothetical protein GWN18_18045 [Thermoplasmata archaeon]|nr:hypothetical protein [Thermoplasmata archaeon]NIS14026.1 hypothetical protein [Thermoplasmata archaeon]NIV80609.1 hypothetical protein [Thermoplasmata archaeon]NIW84418.1 hypothetical protein [Thermoplasmata archaeon]NIW90711.1 hypothetical protein [Thermoplasmata archaeon]
MRGPIDVTVEVANEGTSRADGVRVVMSSDGTPLAEREVGPIEEGSNVTVTFRWKPTVGRHTLTFSVLSDTPEMDLDNNELEHLRTIEDASDEGPGFGLLMVVMALAAVVVGSMSRRRR